MTDTCYDGQERRTIPFECDLRLSGIKTELREDIGEIKDAIKTMAASMSKLALVEERQMQSTAQQERIFVALEKLEQRVSKMELSGVSTRRTSEWIDKAVIGVIVLVAVYASNKIGLSR